MLTGGLHWTRTGLCPPRGPLDGNGLGCNAGVLPGEGGR